MRILVVSATAPEIAPLLERLPPTSNDGSKIRTCMFRAHEVCVLTTGVGMVATAAWCSQAFALARYDLALNFGVCGSFDRSLEPGTVVHVVADRISELGAQDGSRFLTVHDLQLLGENEFPFRRGMLVNDAPPGVEAIRRLPAVEGITVNTVHGHEQSIAAVVERFGPRVESMEGAAFMYACLINGVPFAQVRAVSNVVETRNREAWKMPDAIRNLGETAVDILGQL